MALVAVLALSLAGAIDFTVDWAAFRAAGDSSRVEFFYSVPHDQLRYEAAGDSGVEARFEVAVTMRALDGDFVQSGSFTKRARLRSFQAAQLAQTQFVDGFSIIAPPGRHSFSLVVSESTPAGVNRGERADTLTLESFAEGLTLSSLQLGTSTATDTSTGAVSVVPNPALQRGVSGHDLVYLYFEAYGFAADTGSCDVRLGILKRGAGRPDSLVKEATVTRSWRGRRLAAALGLSVEGIGPGGYALSVKLSEPGTGRTARAEHAFRLGEPEPPLPSADWLATLPPVQLKHVRDIRFVATPRELAYYNSLSDSGQTAYLAWFWARRDLAEFARRMETVEARYARPRTPGVSTDRGRVYVKYGEPDAVEQRVIETDLRPREYWHYYGTGYSFIFIDVRGDGNHRLAWSNSPEERSTGYESYLSPEELNQFK